LGTGFTLLALLTAPPSVGDEGRASVESTVLFNTDCARCHEGECSGRLSFHLPPEAADQHIRRHGGELPAKQVRELYELLRYMKEDCAFYPLPFALVLDGAWGTETLGRLRSASGETYFLPLGTLSPGEQRVLLQGQGPTARPCIELIGGDFEYFDGVELEPEQGGWRLRFRTQAAGELFLRVKVPGSTELTRIEMVAKEGVP
jgi:hypothetical protein